MNKHLLLSVIMSLFTAFNIWMIAFSNTFNWLALVAAGFCAFAVVGNFMNYKESKK